MKNDHQMKRDQYGSPEVSQEAFREIYDETHSIVWNFILRKCLGDHSRAEEVFQETWITFHQSRFQFDFRHSEIQWLMIMARSRFLDHVRKKTDL
jgi:DNA-directed RNA polymerase specialized sigma24 family protein